nr:hypothetical protein GCM10020093_059940 [Planobispora longispora]
MASQPGALAVAGNRFVAVPTQQGSAKGEVPVYCSANGGSWDRCGAITGLGPQGSGVKRLASSATGAFAVAESGLEHYVAFTSQDGRKWSPSTDLGTVSGSLRALAVSDEGTLVVGGDQRAIGVDNRLVLITAAREGAARAVPLDTIEGLNRVARETTGLAAGDGRFVAVGAASGDAGIWTSEDGEAWDTAGPARLLGGEHWQALSDVVYGRRGWLAVGSTMSAVAATEPLLVTSADGRSWRRVPIMDSLARGGHSLLAPRAVAAGPSGYVLAGEEGEPGATTAVLWFSADLKGYTRAARLPAGGAGVRLHDVSPTSSGYMAVGGSGTGEQETGVVWVSADGVNWTARKPLLPSGATAAGLRHVVTYGGQVVAVGTAETAQGRRAFGAVSRDNGATWRTAWLPADRAAAVLDLAATPDGVVAVGWHGVQGEGDSSAWTSEDGLSWQRHEPAEGGSPARAPSGWGPWRSPATRWWPWAGPPPTTPTISPCGARPWRRSDERPSGEGLQQAGGERQARQLAGAEPACVGGVVTGGERAAGDLRQVVADLVDDVPGPGRSTVPPAGRPRPSARSPRGPRGRPPPRRTRRARHGRPERTRVPAPAGVRGAREASGQSCQR